jgi:hypothetical protein
MRIEFTMTQEKQTKNKVVYKNLEAPIDTVYVDKNQLRNHMEGMKDYPATITLTIEA